MTDNNNKPETKETSRIEAFSDGVFAIAITLLVLELITTLHHASGDGLVNNIVHHWQSFVAFVIGFITILVCWINHHIALEYVKRIDTKFMWVNGFLLFVVTLTPFPTAILAEYLEKEGATAMAIFGFNYFLISLAANAVCSYAYNNHLVATEHREFYSYYKAIYWYGIFYTFIVFLLCFVSVYVSLALYVVLFAAFSAPKELAAHLHKLRTARKK